MLKQLILLTLLWTTVFASGVSPGKEFTISAGGVSARVLVPTDYKVDGTYPLVAWYGNLLSSPNPIPYLRNNSTLDKEAVLMSVPAEEGKGWDYYKPLFDELEKRIPNIRPSWRVAACHDTGGPVLCGMLGDSKGGIQKYFKGFMIGKGGIRVDKPVKADGLRFFLYVGAHDFNELKNLQALAPKLRGAGADVDLLVSRDFMHDPGSQHMGMYLDWMKKKVMFRDLPAAKAELDKALTAKNWAAAIQAGQKVMQNSCPVMSEYQTAQQALKQAGEFAHKEADKLLAAGPTKGQLRNFLQKFGVCACAAKVRDALNALGEKEFEKLTASRCTAAKVKRFMSEWQGLPVHVKALAKYDRYARKGLDAILAKNKDVALAKNLREFMHKWKDAPAAAEAREALESTADDALAAAKAIDSRTKRKHKLKSIVKYFVGTKAAAKAQQLLQ
ncbi:hypothetical protein ACFL4W_04015 [Planctomycetota bacterium]